MSDTLEDSQRGESTTPPVLDTKTPSTTPPVRDARATVARNTALLIVGQVLGMPLSLLLNAVMARKIGPEEFGYIYLAGTLVAFGFLVVEWGQSGTIPMMIARDRSRAGVLLGSGLAWRALSSLLVYGVLVLVAALLGYGTRLQLVLALVVVARVIGTTNAAYLDVGRGLEDMRMTAQSLMRYNFLCAGLVIPALLLGGRMLAALTALIVADAINLFFVMRTSRKLGIGKLSITRDAIKAQLSTGTSFMMLGLALALQPNVDAILLAKFGTPEAIGWHAAAKKLIGLLVFPVSAIANALYPTLCRLHAETTESFNKMLRTTLRTSVLIVVPVTLGCALYADLGILIFSKQLFEPARDNLRILSLFLFLLYFTMILGAGLAAAGKQRAWTAAQCACVLVSAVLDPVLIPWFQRRSGNGGLGVCVASVISEGLMVSVGFWLSPRGLVDKSLLVGVRASVFGGIGMAIVAVSLAYLQVSPFLAAPLAVLTYGGCLWLLGELDKDQLDVMRSIIGSKIGRAPG